MSSSSLATSLASAPVRVVVAEMDPLARRVIMSALLGGGIEVLAAATSVDAAVEFAVSRRPDVLVSGLAMPDGDGLAAIQRLRDSGCEVSVLIFSSREEPEVALRAFEAGALGYVGKSAGTDALVPAVLAVASGEAVIPRRLARQVLERLRARRGDTVGLRPVRSPLTPREWEVFELLCTGASTRIMASELVLSPETIRSHVKSILAKLGVRDRREAVACSRSLRLAAAPEALQRSVGTA